MINLHYYTPQSCYMDRFSHIMHSFYLSILEFIHVSAIDFGSNTIDRYFSNSSNACYTYDRTCNETPAEASNIKVDGLTQMEYSNSKC